MIYKIEQFKIKSIVAEGYQLQNSFTHPCSSPPPLSIMELYFKNVLQEYLCSLGYSPEAQRLQEDCRCYSQEKNVYQITQYSIVLTMSFFLIVSFSTQLRTKIKIPTFDCYSTLLHVLVLHTLVLN